MLCMSQNVSNFNPIIIQTAPSAYMHISMCMISASHTPCSLRALYAIVASVSVACSWCSQKCTMRCAKVSLPFLNAAYTQIKKKHPQDQRISGLVSHPCLFLVHKETFIQGVFKLLTAFVINEGS